MNKELSPINYFLKLTEGMFPKEDQKSIEENLNSIQEDVPEDVVDDYHFPDYRLKDPNDSQLVPEFLQAKKLVEQQLLDKYGPPDPNPNWAENRRRELGRPPSEYERARKLVEEQRKEMEKDPEGEMSNVPFDKGGQVLSFIQHLQTGGEALDADTTMEVGNVPMGIVSDPDGAPSPFNGGTGVEDDLDMEVESGSYVLNAEAVQLVGISDINEVIRDAYSIAMALGKQMPEDYDPQNKVPIRISNGEAVIPKVLVDIIGLDKLEKWNNKGLDIRKQREEQQPQPQEPQIATEAPPMQSPNAPMGFNQGSVVPPLSQEEFLASQRVKDERRNDRYRELVRGDTEDIPLPTSKPPDIPLPISKPIDIPLPISKPELPDPYNTEIDFGKYSPNQEIRITELTVGELLEHGRQTVNNQRKAGIQNPKKRSSAMGAYQFLTKTLKNLLKDYPKLVNKNSMFTPDLQDKLALKLLEETGVDKYFDNPSNLNKFQNKVAHVWASLPNTKNKSSHDQSLAKKSKLFQEELSNIQQEVERKTISALEGKYKILEIIKKAETKKRK